METVFLFGSGADTDVCDDLKSGQSFAEALFVEKNRKEVSSLLGNGFSDFQLIYPTSTKVFVQTVASFPDEAKGILSDRDIKNCTDYYSNKKSVDYDVIKELGQKWYKALKNGTDESVKKFFFEKAVFFDSLDEKFNSLRHTKPNDSAKRVINAYTTIFVLMMKGLYNLDEFDWKFRNVFDKLDKAYDIKCESESYYRLLKDSEINCHVVTTNYTDLAERESGQQVTYLHGKLTWFEDLLDLSIYDCTKEEERNHLLNAERILPFILIPSGVKPLICTKQIEQFSDFINKLRGSNEMCVVGYRFNSEDNHINSIIAEWLRREKHRLIYFNYNGGIDFSKFEWAKNLEVNSIDYISTDNMKLTDAKIQNINVCKENSRKAFSDYLKLIGAEKGR